MELACTVIVAGGRQSRILGGLLTITFATVTAEIMFLWALMREVLYMYSCCGALRYMQQCSKIKINKSFNLRHLLRTSTTWRIIERAIA